MPVTRAVLYARVSTQDQAREGVSLETQENLARKYCEERGWALVDTYVDVQSGRSDRRPQLKRMEQDAQARKFDVVIVYKLDRLARSTATFYRIVTAFRDKDIALASLTEDLDFTSIQGKAMMGMLAIFAEIFSDQLSERVKSAMQTVAAKSQWHTGARAPFGYRLIPREKREDGTMTDPTVEVIPAEAEIVREIFATFLRNRNLRATCDELFRRGIRTKSGYTWQSQTLKYFLRNPVYIGASAWGKYRGSKGGRRARIPTDPSTWVVTEGTHEAIIDRETWDEVQKILEKNHKLTARDIYARRKYAWNGLVRCGASRPDGSICGFAMTARTRVDKRSGWSDVEYFCNAYIDMGASVCPDRGRLAGRFLDWVVIPRLDELLRSVGVSQAANAKIPRKQPKTEEPIRRIEALEARRAREKDLFREGYSTFEEMAANIKKIDAEIEQLKQVSTAPAPLPALPTSLCDVWERLNPDEQRDLLQSFIAFGEVTRTTFRIHLRPYDHPDWPESIEIPITSVRRLAWQKKKEQK